MEFQLQEIVVTRRGPAVALSLAGEGVRLAVAARRMEKLEGVARRARNVGAPEAAARCG